MGRYVLLVIGYNFGRMCGKMWLQMKLCMNTRNNRKEGRKRRKKVFRDAKFLMPNRFRDIIKKSHRSNLQKYVVKQSIIYH